MCGVGQSFRAGGGRRQVVLAPTSLDIPVDRLVAVVGDRGAGKTTLLRIIAGLQRPEQGRVLRPGQLSPLINGGRLMHPGLTGLENLRFVARCYGFPPDGLTAAVDAFCALGWRLTLPTQALDAAARRSLEAAVAMVIPFAAYLMDDAQQLPPALLAQCVEVARAQGSGLLAATTSVRWARQNADSVVALRHGVVQVFDNAERAMAFLGPAA